MRAYYCTAVGQFEQPIFATKVTSMDWFLDKKNLPEAEKRLQSFFYQIRLNKIKKD